MEPLWSLVNLNQLIYLFPLLSVHVPSNALLAFQALSFTQGDLIVIKLALNYLFDHTLPSSSSKAYNSKF